jgi:hypothetical protein
MQTMPRRIGWTALSLTIASFALGAPLGWAAFNHATVLVKSSETGYLLYPRTAVCAPAQAGSAAPAAGTPATRRYWIRPARTAKAVMPPALGQTLSSESLTSWPTALNGPAPAPMSRN